MRKSIGLISAIVLTGTVLGVSAPAQAADAGLTVSAGRLVFEPGARGYTGSYTFTVTNTGAAPVYGNISITEPVADSFRGILDPSDACLNRTLSGPGPQTWVCTIPGGQIAPGEARRIRADLAVLTTPRAYAMRAADVVTKIVSEDDPTPSTATSRTLFRSTGGALTNPRPYVRDEKSDLAVVSAGDVTLTEQEDGSFFGTLPVTVRWGGDAPHFAVGVAPVLPEGFFLDLGRTTEICDSATCLFGYEPFMQGETRTLQVPVGAPAGTPAGTTATGSVTPWAYWFETLTDMDPADDSAQFRITVG